MPLPRTPRPTAVVSQRRPRTAWDSRFVPDESSVAYSGQTFRHVLIQELTNRVDVLTARIDSLLTPPSDGDIASELLFYYEFDGQVGGEVPLSINTDPGTLQDTYSDISGGADLESKIAGNDPVGQHEDWSSAFVGIGAAGSVSPDALVRRWIEELDEAAQARSRGDLPQAPDGSDIDKVYLTADGRDLKQLLQKFLLGAIAFSQGADDYLDDDTADKGLLSSNAQDDDKPYSPLEHAWDEGFGYFGAARDSLAYTDDQIANPGYRDTDGDGRIDLGTEFHFGHSVNAAKRDRGSAASAPTDFTDDIVRAFIAGRGIIAGAGEELTPAEMTRLIAQRDIIVTGWEKVIAANVVHYINDTLVDMAAIGTVAYDFEDHAKHWSEMKGFALGLQFSPHSPLSSVQFAELHDLMGEAPVLTAAEVPAYAADLRAARAILGQAYDFDAANLGDDAGLDGW